MNVAVVGHVEWCHFARVERLPTSGEIIRPIESWREAGGGAGVAAVVLARLAGSCTLFTAFGNDLAGQLAREQLQSLGVEVHAGSRTDAATKESMIYLDAGHERTITVFGDLEPGAADALPLDILAGMDAVYFVSGDAELLRAARQAKVLVATSRELPTLKEASVPLEALVMSQKDTNEAYQSGDLDPAPALVVRTSGNSGGGTLSGEHYRAEPIDPADFQDTYGCGDSFAAGLIYALGQNLSVTEALAQAARCGAEAARRRGAHGLQPDR